VVIGDMITVGDVVLTVREIDELGEVKSLGIKAKE